MYTAPPLSNTTPGTTIDAVISMPDATPYLLELIPSNQLEKDNGKQLLAEVAKSEHSHLIHATHASAGEILALFSENHAGVAFYLLAPDQRVGRPFSLPRVTANDLGQAAAVIAGWDWTDCVKVDAAPARPCAAVQQKRKNGQKSSDGSDDEAAISKDKKTFDNSNADRADIDILRQIVPVSNEVINDYRERGAVCELVERLYKAATKINQCRVIHHAAKRMLRSYVSKSPDRYPFGQDLDFDESGKLMIGRNTEYWDLMHDINLHITTGPKDWVTSFDPKKGGIVSWYRKAVGFALKRIDSEDARIRTAPFVELEEWHVEGRYASSLAKHTAESTADEDYQRRLDTLREQLAGRHGLTLEQRGYAIELIARTIDNADGFDAACTSRLLTPGNLTDRNGLIERLIAHPDPVSKFLWTAFSKEARAALRSANTPEKSKNTVLLEQMNRIIQKPIWSAERFADVPISMRARTWLALVPKRKQDAIRLDTLLLEDAFPDFLKRTTVNFTELDADLLAAAEEYARDRDGAKVRAELEKVATFGPEARFRWLCSLLVKSRAIGKPELRAEIEAALEECHPALKDTQRGMNLLANPDGDEAIRAGLDCLSARMTERVRQEIGQARSLDLDARQSRLLELAEQIKTENLTTLKGEIEAALVRVSKIKKLRAGIEQSTQLDLEFRANVLLKIRCEIIANGYREIQESARIAFNHCLRSLSIQRRTAKAKATRAAKKLGQSASPTAAEQLMLPLEPVETVVEIPPAPARKRGRKPSVLQASPFKSDVDLPPGTFVYSLSGPGITPGYPRKIPSGKSPPATLPATV